MALHAGKGGSSVTDNSLTYAKLQQVAASKLLGNPTGSPANASEIGIAGGLDFSGSSLVGAVNHPGYIAGNWYSPLLGATIQAGSAIGAAGSIRLLPFTLSKVITVAALAARVTTASASGNFQLAIYVNNAATGRPTGAALCSTANLSTGSLAPVSGTVTNVTLQPGTYWMAVNHDNTAAAYTTVSTAASSSAYIIGSATLANMTIGGVQLGPSLSVAQTFGTWPDLTSGSFTEITTAQNAIAFLKAA